jgi:hypothetical protein
LQNPNVMIELGYALAHLGSERLVMMLNGAFGDRTDLPFDLRHKAGPVVYELPEDATKETKRRVQGSLTGELKIAIRECIEAARKERFSEAKSSGTSLALAERQSHWLGYDDRIWSVVTLVPGEPLGPETFDPIAPGVREVLHSIRVPSHVGWSPVPYSYHSRSSATGTLVHEDFRHLDSTGAGYRFELWPSGQVEFAVCLADILATVLRDDRPRLSPGSGRWEEIEALIWWEPYATLVLEQIRSVLEIWERVPLDFEGGVIAAALYRIDRSTLFAPTGGGLRGAILGHRVGASSLSVTTSTTRSINVDDLAEGILRKLVRGFGLHLRRLKDDRGRIADPGPLALAED